MKDIPIDQMGERRLRIELASTLTANQLLSGTVDNLKKQGVIDAQRISDLVEGYNKLAYRLGDFGIYVRSEKEIE